MDFSAHAKRLTEHEEFKGAFGKPISRTPRPTRSSLALTAGLGSQLSDVDEVVFGRDLDGSNDAIKDPRHAKEYSGAAGDISRNLGEAALAAGKTIFRRRQSGQQSDGADGLSPCTVYDDLDERLFSTSGYSQHLMRIRRGKAWASAPAARPKKSQQLVDYHSVAPTLADQYFANKARREAERAGCELEGER